MSNALSLDAEDNGLLAMAVALAAACPTAYGAFAVGAVIADRDGQVLATGYSRELGENWHAEEVAIHKARERGVDLTGATLFSSMEPCSRRLSGRPPCTAHILAAGIARVVYCLDEPPVFVIGEGAATLRATGVAVIQDRQLAHRVMALNRHLFDDAAAPEQMDAS